VRIAAQHDIQGAVRWIRQNAAQFGVNPDKIAVGGFSAGAVIAANLTYRSDDAGDVIYFSGDDRSAAASKIQAGFGASGCAYSPELEPSPDIDAGDGPLALIASRNDGAVPHSCVASTVATARAAGLVAELASYCTESLHSNDLYAAHKAPTDARWTNFLARELKLCTGMAPPTADPLCPT